MSVTIIAMSGGVDSSAAAALMVEQGYDCRGFTLKLYTGTGGCGQAADTADAKAAAVRLGIPHDVLDWTDEFDRQVIRRFAETYEQGATPNPCVICNRLIKFNINLLGKYFSGFDSITTGHYARVEKDTVSGRYLLLKAADIKKDQSYVLYNLDQTQLKYARFPLGAFTKNQVRQIAAQSGFGNKEKPESQDICFVPDGNYGDFIESYTGRISPPGDILGINGKVIGRHRGIIRYTVGQRRGLGVAANIPIYVANKLVKTNTITLGPDSSLYSKTCIVKNINLIACTRLERPLRVTVKTRYLQTEQPAVAEQRGEDELYIEFDSPQRAITPGQAAVLYDGGIVVGGGTIV